ncbi:MAG: flavodoxin family protein [Spirochaetales bacterium]|uniref:Flavodoxin family protein n=1 Tax=Candidatus Thalassospirochaeta sargassi TaxID=3119039 RepID=A0AAJ1IFW2_9SPIO|nr:flavodoxin family protein [Spirochaetales bacterium]
MKITAFEGSPRKNGNSSLLLDAFLEKTAVDAVVKRYRTDELELKPCRGCLMCNVLKHCALRKDDWEKLSEQILDSDVVAFATPIYFHHTTSSMKKLLDRFRSFLHVQITEDGIIHKTHQKWNKKFILLTAHGSSSVEDAASLNELFDFIIETLGPENSIERINAVRLAVRGQIGFDLQQLEKTYVKLGLPAYLAVEDSKKNAEWLATAGYLAENL